MPAELARRAVRVGRAHGLRLRMLLQRRKVQTLRGEAPGTHEVGAKGRAERDLYGGSGAAASGLRPMRALPHRSKVQTLRGASLRAAGKLAFRPTGHEVAGGGFAPLTAQPHINRFAQPSLCLARPSALSATGSCCLTPAFLCLAHRSANRGPPARVPYAKTVRWTDFGYPPALAYAKGISPVATGDKGLSPLTLRPFEERPAKPFRFVSPGLRNDLSSIL